MKTQNIKVPLIDIKVACRSNDKTAMDCRLMSISAARLEMVMPSIFHELICTSKPSWASRALASAVTRSQSPSTDLDTQMRWQLTARVDQHRPGHDLSPSL